MIFANSYGFIDPKNINSEEKKLSKSECEYLKEISGEEKKNPDGQIFIQLATERCRWSTYRENKSEL